MLEINKIRIGRGSFNDIVVDDESVLMEHCYIAHDKTGYHVVNFKKDSKTFVNDNEINWEADITLDDKLRVGNIDVVDWNEAFLNPKCNGFQPVDNQNADITLASTEKKRHGFVTFWIWLAIIGNIISIPVALVQSGKILEPIKYQFFSLGQYNTTALLEGVHGFETALYLTIFIVPVLAIIFLVKLLHWKKIGFWGFAFTIILFNAIYVLIIKLLARYLLSYGLMIYITGLSEANMIIPAFQIVIMWAVLQIRKNGVSCWNWLYWKSEKKD